MDVLIVESNADLGMLWSRHLERLSMTTTLVASQSEAIAKLQTHTFRMIVLDLDLEEGAAIAIADFANYRHPDTKVVFVTNTSFFSDGSIFQHMANACAFLPAQVAPKDLAAIVHYHGNKV
ncbi:Response regulator receiver domain protein [Aquimixticola soesokkakensis]|uniref:Response regulator receiver domain protein n=1 Tax=Aquimixticola soesokkakensis TaxID=1519096 RepID=A0A1Y5RHM6_9RHOB|nr:response regulator [Aquimixticola soesokkakensis]SLN17541.1 Response regulator receiver domain protein [Aquimixticola soesokkakensis]